MERKIGEIFEYKGGWYQCADWDVNPCSKCDFDGKGICSDELPCTSSQRKDKKYVFFKKLEKVGEPYNKSGIMVQKYKVGIPIEMPDEPYMYFRLIDNTVEIEIKNQEDMEENKLNLKPFDLESARNGKPVCTRNGRKARIICFDANDERSIIALLEFKCDNGGYVEKIETYYKDGKVHEESEWVNDLMMLPEKHEGWINIYKTYNDKFAAMTGSLYLYKTEKEAKMEADPDKVLSTVKIEWEE